MFHSKVLGNFKAIQIENKLYDVRHICKQMLTMASACAVNMKQLGIKGTRRAQIAWP